MLIIVHLLDRDFDRDLNLLMADIIPSLLAPKGYRARSAIGDAFQHYYENYIPGKTHSSAMIQARYATNTEYGISTWNQGRLEVGALIGILVNTIPSAFYMLIHIYSDRALLHDIRCELEATSVMTAPSGGQRTLRIITMRKECHLLHSTFQELLRIHALGTSARFVLEDTMLDNQYLLRKGMMIQMPAAIMHADSSIWGSNASEFQPRRFLKQNEAGKGSKEKPVAYRPFGGGVSLCPGRHLVTLEVLAIAAYMILRFDMAPVNGQWNIPVQQKGTLTTNVFPPQTDVRVKVTRRHGLEKIDWDFVAS